MITFGYRSPLIIRIQSYQIKVFIQIFSWQCKIGKTGNEQ